MYPNAILLCGIAIHERFKSLKDEEHLFPGRGTGGRYVTGNYIRENESYTVHGEYEYAVPIGEELERIKRGELLVYVTSVVMFTDQTGDKGWSLACHTFTGMDLWKESELEAAEPEFCLDHNPKTEYAKGNGKGWD